MPTAHANGIDIEYRTEGDPADPVLLLVMGLGGQLIAWPQGFVDGLRTRGFYVIRYDNRDCGLSAKFEGTPDISLLLAGDGSSAPYRIEDMADDATALLTELGISKAHVVGVSMGGMIAQAMAVNHQDRLLSACSIMSTTGDRSVGAPTGEAVAALLRPIATNRQEAVDASSREAVSSGRRSSRRTRRSSAGAPRMHMTARTALRERRVNSPRSSPRRTGPRGCTECACLSW